MGSFELRIYATFQDSSIEEEDFILQKNKYGCTSFSGNDKFNSNLQNLKETRKSNRVKNGDRPLDNMSDVYGTEEEEILNKNSSGKFEIESGQIIPFTDLHGSSQEKSNFFTLSNPRENKTRKGNSGTQTSDKDFPKTMEITDFEVQYKKPKYSDYVYLDVRISSFNICLTDASQTGNTLAEAGFFFAGEENLIKCFHCGGGLKNWDIEDDPWVEHAHWFPDCVFLRQNKGDGFIDFIQQLSSNNQSEAESEILLQEDDTDKDMLQTQEWSEKQACTNHVQALQTLSTDNQLSCSRTLCKVCLVSDISIVFLPCRHMVTCSQCSPAMAKCPICRENIKGTIKAYLS